MNTTLTAFTANTGWNMLKKAGQNRYYLFAPANLKGELRNVLTDVIGYLLTNTSRCLQKPSSPMS